MFDHSFCAHGLLKQTSPSHHEWGCWMSAWIGTNLTAATPIYHDSRLCNSCCPWASQNRTCGATWKSLSCCRLPNKGGLQKRHRFIIISVCWDLLFMDFSGLAFAPQPLEVPLFPAAGRSWWRARRRRWRWAATSSATAWSASSACSSSSAAISSWDCADPLTRSAVPPSPTSPRCSGAGPLGAPLISPLDCWCYALRCIIMICLKACSWGLVPPTAAASCLPTVSEQLCRV